MWNKSFLTKMDDPTQTLTNIVVNELKALIIKKQYTGI